MHWLLKRSPGFFFVLAAAYMGCHQEAASAPSGPVVVSVPSVAPSAAPPPTAPVTSAQPSDPVPASSVESSAPSATASAPTTGVSDADRVVAGLRPRLRNCYMRALASDPSLTGQVHGDITIAGDGRVTGVKLTGVTPELRACIATVIKSANLGPTGDAKPMSVHF